MSWRVSSRIRVVAGMSVVVLAAARLATAQCDGPKRPPKPAEAKSYADGFALFQRMAPPTPAGFTAADSRTESTVTFICGDATDNFTRWSFSRTYSRNPADMQARGDAALTKTQAVTARAAERNKAKEAKLADLDRRVADLAKRIEAAAASQNFAAMAAISEESNKMAEERAALMTDGAAESEMAAIGADVDRDGTAQFTMIYGETDVTRSSAFKPMTSAVGKGYRQDYQDRYGNPVSDLVVVLPPVAGVAGQTLVQINGDTARAEGLLKAAKLR